MVMTLARKSKVEQSPHFEEIVTRLSKGESARSVSKWLKNEHNEIISHAALARYNNKCINMQDKVEAELNRRAEEKKKKLQLEKEKAQKEQFIQERADAIESAEETVNIVAETIADNMEGVAKVAAQFPEKFEEACREASYPDSNVSSKDVARLALDANKLYNEYFKQEGPAVEVNVDKNVTVNLLDKVKEKRRELNDLRNNGRDI